MELKINNHDYDYDNNNNKEEQFGLSVTTWLESIWGNSLNYEDPILALIDLFMGILFWTSLTSMIAMLWFFPMYKMYFTGYELGLLCLWMPGIVLSIPKLREQWVFSNSILLHWLPLLTFVSRFVQHQGARLIVLSLGTGFFLTDMAARCLANSISLSITQKKLAAEDTSSMEIIQPVIYTRFLLGLLASVILRIGSRAIDVFAPNLRENWGSIVALVLGTLAIVIESKIRQSSSNSRISWISSQANVRSLSPTSGSQTDSSISPFSNITEWMDDKWWLDGAGVGSLILLSGFLLTESTTISRWSLSQTLPNMGVPPLIGSVLMVISMFAGIILSLRCPSRRILHPIWWITGIVGMLMLSFAQTYLAFFGGMITVGFLTSVWPYMMNKATRNPDTIGKTWFLATTFYSVGIVAAVYCICYNFVPGGMAFREKTHWLLLVALSLVSLSLFEEYRKTQFSKWINHRLIAPRLGFLCLGFVLAILFRLPYNIRPIQTIPKVPGMFGTMIWTIHFAYDNDNSFAHRGLAAMIRDSGMDVIGLLETDANRLFKGNRDLVMWLAEELQMYSDYGLNSRAHNWGCALLSKYPIVHSRSFNLPSPDGENACAIHATLKIQQRDVDIVVAHFGTEEFPEDRRQQSLYLSQLFRSITNPMVFLGYLVTKPRNPAYPNYFTIVEGGQVKDIYPDDKDRWCQYILYRNLTRLAYARITHGELSDTEAQVATFYLNQANDFDSVITEDELPDPLLKLPDLFLGNGTRGHRYEIFDRPIYFG